MVIIKPTIENSPLYGAILEKRILEAHKQDFEIEGEDYTRGYLSAFSGFRKFWARFNPISKDHLKYQAAVSFLEDKLKKQSK